MLVDMCSRVEVPKRQRVWWKSWIVGAARCRFVGYVDRTPPRARTVVFPVRITVVSLSRGGRRPEREEMLNGVFNLISKHRVVK